VNPAQFFRIIRHTRLLKEKTNGESDLGDEANAAGKLAGHNEPSATLGA
jgi:hypothetical protein